MKKNLLPVPEARRRILQSQRPLPTEKIPLGKAFLRILGQPLKANEDRPAFDRSAMDGYAICNRQEEPYSIQNVIPAGNQSPSRIKSGQCLRIYTGSKLPGNCLAVIPQEQVEIIANTIKVSHWPANTFIRRRGEDARRGDVLLKRNTLLRAPELAVLAQEGIANVSVYERVHVTHLAMGKELVDPAKKPRTGQIRDSNSSLIAALLQQPTYQLLKQKRIADEPELALAFLQSTAAHKSDILLISGGAGPGDHDWGRHLIRKLGFRILHDGIDLRPGKPLIAARKGKQTLFILPGNPVSHWVTWQLCVEPLLKHLSGLKPEAAIIQSCLASFWKHSKDPRQVWWPGHLDYRGGKAVASPLALQSSGDASRLCGANCLIHFPQNKQNFQPGDEVATMICHTL